MNRKIFLLCGLFISLLLFCSCGSEPIEPIQETYSIAMDNSTAVTVPSETETEIPQPKEEALISQLDFDTVLAQANDRHRSVIKPGDDQLELYTKGRIPDVSQIDTFSGDIPTLVQIPIEDAIADTEDLFELMRNCYGGYTFFGGDEVFDEVKQTILEKLEPYENISTADFAGILTEHLFSVISDNHFSINYQRQPQKDTFYYSKSESFVKDGDVFISRSNHKRLESVDGYDIDDIFRLHVNSSGEFVWNPIVLMPSDTEIPKITLRFEDGTTQTVYLYQYIFTERPQDTSLDRSGGYPVVTIHQMGGSKGKHDVVATAFLEYAEELRDEQVVIVDLRGNPGGNGLLSRKWMHILTGERISTNNVALRAMPFQPLEYPEEDVEAEEGLYYVTAEDLDIYFRNEPYENGYTMFYNEADMFLEREQILILLVNRGTASAAEIFVDLCFNVENTLVIGSNTGGVLNFDLSHGGLTLPRSGLPFGFGTTMFLHPEGHLIEGLGIMPDVWVSGDALEATIAMLKKAGY